MGWVPTWAHKIVGVAASAGLAVWLAFVVPIAFGEFTLAFDKPSSHAAKGVAMAGFFYLL